MRRSLVALSLFLFAPACTLGDVNGENRDGDDGDGDGDGDVPDATLEIVSPAPGAMFTRETVGTYGYLVAAVPLDLTVGASIAELAYTVNGSEQRGRAAAADFDIAEVRKNGDASIVVLGFDAAGDRIAQASVDVVAIAPAPVTCYDWLDLYGLRYDRGPARQGVSDPVTVKTPINGLEHRYVTQDAPRTSFFMDCRLARELAQAAPLLRERDVVEIADIGVYNYRCIGGGTPPCGSSGISQHAYAKAIDVAGYKDSKGNFYSVLNHWVIDPDSQKTCAAPTENVKDEFLHKAICAQKQAGYWNVVLTPNYNSDHRNHFHTDLTPGSDSIYLETAEPAVDVGPDTH